MSEHPLASNSRVVGDDLRRAERSIQTAIRDVAQLIGSIIDTARSNDIPAATCQAAIAPAADTLRLLVESHDVAANRVHRTLEHLGHRLGLDETNWGGSDVKHMLRVARPTTASRGRPNGPGAAPCPACETAGSVHRG